MKFFAIVDMRVVGQAKLDMMVLLFGIKRARTMKDLNPTEMQSWMGF